MSDIQVKSMVAIPAELIERGFSDGGECDSDWNGEYYSNLEVSSGLHITVYRRGKYHGGDPGETIVFLDSDLGGYEGRCEVQKADSLPELLPLIDGLIALLKP
jgi:hypothetical protein